MKLFYIKAMNPSLVWDEALFSLLKGIVWICVSVLNDNKIIMTFETKNTFFFYSLFLLSEDVKHQKYPELWLKCKLENFFEVPTS